MVNQAILTKDDPLGDVFFGVDNTFLGRALDEEIFEPYRSPALGDVPHESHELDRRRHRDADRPRRRVRQLRQAVVRRRRARAARRRSTTSPSPRTRACSWSRTRPRRRPASRSCSRTIAHYGEDGWRDYWDQLRANDVKVDDGWEDAYDGDVHGQRGPGAVPARRLVRVEPAGRGRASPNPQPDDVADRRHRSTRASARSSSPACSRAPSTKPPRASSSTSCCQPDVPGGHAAPDVRVPRRATAAAPDGLREVRRRARRSAGAPGRRDRRQPRPVDRRSGHRRPAAEPIAPCARARRSRSSPSSSSGRSPRSSAAGSAPDGVLDRGRSSRRPPAPRRVVHASGRRSLSTVLTLADRAARRVRARALRLPGPARSCARSSPCRSCCRRSSSAPRSPRLLGRRPLRSTRQPCGRS